MLPGYCHVAEESSSSGRHRKLRVRLHQVPGMVSFFYISNDRLEPDDQFLAAALRQEPLWLGYYQDVHYVPLLSNNLTPAGFYTVGTEERTQV